MELLLYSHDWAPIVGGISTLTRALADGLTEWSGRHATEYINVTLVTNTPAGHMDDSLLPYRVVRRPSLLRLVSLLRSADVVHLTGVPFAPLALGLLLRKSIVVEHDGYQAACPTGLFVYMPDQTVCPDFFMQGKYQRCLLCNAKESGWAKSIRSLLLMFPRRWMAERVDVNIAPSRHIGRRVALPRTQMIHHCVRIPAAHSERSPLELNGKPPCFAFVGRLVREKGVPVFLEAAHQLLRTRRPFHLKIAGDGPERQNLQELAGKLGLQECTDFLGSLPPEKLPDVLSDAVAVVIPSVCEDVAPLVAVEQMIQGRLLIGSDIGGLGEFVEGVGLKFPPGDANALRSCLLQVLENPDLARDLGRKGSRRALEDFSEESNIQSHVRIYQGLVQGRSMRA